MTTLFPLLRFMHPPSGPLCHSVSLGLYVKSPSHTDSHIMNFPTRPWWKPPSQTEPKQTPLYIASCQVFQKRKRLSTIGQSLQTLLNSWCMWERYESQKPTGPGREWLFPFLLHGDMSPMQQRRKSLECITHLYRSYLCIHGIYSAWEVGTDIPSHKHPGS